MVTDKKLGFIGAGNMGEALFKGLLNTKAAKPAQIFVSARRPERVRELAQAYGVRGGSNAEVAREADVVVLCVKPQILALKYIEALQHIAGAEGSSKVFIPYEATALLGALGTLGEAVGVKALPKPKAG